MIQSIRRRFDRSLEALIIFIMGANVINVLWQVFTRFILRNPSSYTEELARYLLIWGGLLTAAYIVSTRMHLAIDILHDRMSPALRRLTDLLIQSLIFLFALSVLVIGGVKLVLITLYLDQTSAALQIPVGYVYTVLPLSGLIIMVYSGLEFLSLLNERPRSAEGRI